MTHITLAAMLGGWELIIILVVLLTPVVIGGVVLLVYFLTRSRKSKVQSVPPKIPPATVRLRNCPKCGSPLNADAPEGLCPACLLQHGFATEGGAPAGQTAFVPPTIAELAKLFPQLEIISVIGKGGMGAVYKARQPALDRMVALKILAPQPGNELDFASRFSREARALARLNHPNIVGVYDFGVVSGLSSESGHRPDATLSYFIMEFVDGPNLRQVQQAGKLSPREALEIIPQICAALQFAHDEGIVHRDIKPENVLLDKKGRVKIADFGLAKILGQEAKDFRLTGAKDVMGTPHYMAPEQVETPQEVDHRADIFSLGVVFYEMLTGELPLGKFAPPSQKVQVDVRLDEIVLRALEKEPRLRYQQASELKTRVETVAGSAGKPANPRGEFSPGSNESALARHFIRGVKTAGVVFVLTVLMTVVVTFLLPKSYLSVARIKIGPANENPMSREKTPETLFVIEMERMQSPEVLKDVAATLNLSKRWGAKFNRGAALPEQYQIELLEKAVRIRRVPGTGLIEIEAYSDSAAEAAEIANQIANSEKKLSSETRVFIADPAVPAGEPEKPKVALNIFAGVGIGLLLGGLLGLSTGLVSFWKESRGGKLNRVWGWLALAIALVLVVFILVPTVASVASFLRRASAAREVQLPIETKIIDTNRLGAIET